MEDILLANLMIITSVFVNYFMDVSCSCPIAGRRILHTICRLCSLNFKFFSIFYHAIIFNPTGLCQRSATTRFGLESRTEGAA
jgi:hypothetical protein